MKMLLEISDSFLKELKKDMSLDVITGFMVGEIGSNAKLLICVCNAAVKGEQEIMRNGNVLVSAKLVEE